MYDGIDSGSVLLNRGLNGFYGNQGNFVGDGSAVKEAVRGNRDIALLESVNANGRTTDISNQIRQHNESIQDNINLNNQFLTDRINQQAVNERFSSMERLLFAQQNDAQRDRTEILRAVDSVKCCCEANSAKIDSLAALNAKDLEITKLQLQLAQSNNGPGRGN